MRNRNIVLTCSIASATVSAVNMFIGESLFSLLFGVTTVYYVLGYFLLDRLET